MMETASFLSDAKAAALTSLHGNTFFTGTVGALVLGGAMVTLRRLPAQAWRLVKSRFTATLTIRRPDTPLFEEITDFLSARRLRFSASDFEAHGRTVSLGMGMSLVRWRRQVLKVNRSLEVVGNGVIEKLAVTFWARRKEVLQEFLTEATHREESTLSRKLTSPQPASFRRGGAIAEVPREERMKVIMRADSKDAMRKIKELVPWARKNSWNDVLVRVDMPEDRSRVVSVARDADASNVLFVKSELVEVKNDIDSCAENFNEELVRKAIEMFKQDGLT